MIQIIVGYVILPVLLLLTVNAWWKFLIKDDFLPGDNFPLFLRGFFFFILFLIIGEFYFLYLTEFL